MSRDRRAIELKEFAGIRYTEALAVVRGERWPDACVRSARCLVSEWLSIHGIGKSGAADDRVCNCEECSAQ